MDNIKDSKSAYISAKTDKLAAAVYLVTNNLSDSEPLKWKLRDLAVQTLFLKAGYQGDLSRSLQSVINLLDLGITSGSVSIMNFTVLQNEYKNLVNMVNDSSVAGLKSSLFVKELLPSPPIESYETKIAPRPIVKEQSFTSHTNNEGKEMRQSLITKYVRGKGWTAIKDIAKAVPDCSVKTVQRELAELVEQGVLKKKGDRRWSRYMLAI